MVIYSHSRLSTFEKCPYKFKLRYIDKIIPEVEQTIESHLGKCVHDALEWLYKHIKDKKPIPSLDNVIIYYSERWQRDYTPEFLIVRQEYTAKDYFNKGIQFILNYYQKYYPFDDNTLDVEKKILIDLNGKGKYKIQGYIDRLSMDLKTGEFIVHDYKTANFLPSQEQMDQDRQLALYSIAIKELYGNDKKVCLTWHYLAHDIKICSWRTDQQIEKLKRDTMKLIDEIESTTKFPTYISKLCDWCEYKSICPAWNADKQKKLIVKNEEKKIAENKVSKDKGLGDKTDKVEKNIETKYSGNLENKDIKNEFKLESKIEISDKKVKELKEDELDIW